MKIAICDDNPAECGAIAQALEHYGRQNSLQLRVTSFSAAEALLEGFCAELYDIIFLDVYLPGLSGMEAAHRIRALDPNCPLIFITVSRQHALEAFSVHAVSYILKPPCSADIARAMDTCAKLLQKNSRYIEVTSGQVPVQIPIKHITYIEVFGKKSVFHLTGGQVATYLPLAEIERMLGGLPFLRCHRSYMINIRYIDTLRADSVLMKPGVSVPLRQKGRRQIRLLIAGQMVQDSLGEESL